MDLFSIIKGGKYFDKHIVPKCDYCRFGKRAKDGNKVLCEKRGLVDANYSCGKFLYSPLKRIPVKQLNFVGSLADEDLYIESAGDRAEKEEELKKNSPNNKKTDSKKSDGAKPDENKKPEAPEEAKEAPKSENAENKPENTADNSVETPAEKAETPAEKNENTENAPAEKAEDAPAEKSEPAEEPAPKNSEDAE